MRHTFVSLKNKEWTDAYPSSYFIISSNRHHQENIYAFTKILKLIVGVGGRTYTQMGQVHTIFSNDPNLLLQLFRSDSRDFWGINLESNKLQQLA